MTNLAERMCSGLSLPCHAVSKLCKLGPASNAKGYIECSAEISGLSAAQRSVECLIGTMALGGATEDTWAYTHTHTQASHRFLYCAAVGNCTHGRCTRVLPHIPYKKSCTDEYCW